MGVAPPFLYDPPSQYTFDDPYSGRSRYNPKAVSQASLIPQRPRPKQEGPLVNFNKHPDSYLILPYGNTNAKPMSGRVKKSINYARWFQLSLRICALLGAIGLLVCVICVKHAQTSVGWIIRVPPAVAILHNLYGVIHLCRPSKARTPMSSSSYHIFSAGMDITLIPFYVFTALVSKSQYQESENDSSRWQSVFHDNISTNKIIGSVFLFGVTDGGLHLICLAISIYLAIIFHKIGKLPPDMNPLEDNLTSRHKKKNSSVSEISTKRSSQATTASTSDFRSSKHSSMVEAPLLPSSRAVPFMHTRTDSNDTFSTHNPNTVSNRNSRSHLPSQEAAASKRHSRSNIARSSGRTSPAKRGSTYSESESQRGSHEPSTLPMSTTPATNGEDSDLGIARRRSHSSLLNDNWYVISDTLDDDQDEEFHHDQTLDQEQEQNENLPPRPTSPTSPPKTRKSNAYTPLPQQDSPISHPALKLINPLEMNPPTPPPPSASPVSDRALTPTTTNRASTPGAASASNISRGGTPLGSSIHRVATSPKRRYYGELKKASGTPPPTPPPASASSSPTRGGYVRAQAQQLEKHQQQQQQQQQGMRGTYVDLPRQGDGHADSDDLASGPGMERGGGGGGRAISHSGADYFPPTTTATMTGRRDVSGKVAEEGRGGGGWTARFRKVSGVLM
ncbi:MAG: hypothetical protein M1819_005334 [Sarea resinae]|nr:MAG: hypothetical protein M1819_005334 [Sarea resinae]